MTFEAKYLDASAEGLHVTIVYTSKLIPVLDQCNLLGVDPSAGFFKKFG